MSREYWRPAGGEWCGLPAVVIGSGESLSLSLLRQIALARLADRCRVIAINDAALVAWFADIAFSPHAGWWEERGLLAGFSGLRLQLHSVARSCDGIPGLERSGSEGFEPEPGRVRTHGNSGAMMVQLAAQMGALVVAVCGIDFGGDRWFGRYESEWMNADPDRSVWAERFERMAAEMLDQGFDVVTLAESAARSWLPYRSPAALFR